MPVQIPHFDMPFRFAPGGSVVTVEQNSQEDIDNCVEAIVRTPLGFRAYVPRFGIFDPAFEIQPINTDVINAQISLNEPRAQAQIRQDPDAFDELIVHVKVGVTEYV
jgi:hypothetical protein